MYKYCNVSFFNDSVSNIYNLNDIDVFVGCNVIVNSKYGVRFGKVSYIFESSNYIECEYEIIRIASRKDYLQNISNIKIGASALKKIRDIAKKDLSFISVIDSTYNFDKSLILIRFVSDNRVDFREFVKHISSIFKVRIELRQIGIRDKAKSVGGIGPCGRFLCCSTFLSDFDSISINMAKNQSLSLNPAKINGVCGRLFCCLKFENDNYK